METTIKDKESGDLVAKILTSLFVRGIGGFGHKGTIKNSFPQPSSKRDPDASVEEKTDKNQAFLYRLNGDFNPLHVDP